MSVSGRASMSSTTVARVDKNEPTSDVKHCLMSDNTKIRSNLVFLAANTLIGL